MSDFEGIHRLIVILDSTEMLVRDVIRKLTHLGMWDLSALDVALNRCGLSVFNGSMKPNWVCLTLLQICVDNRRRAFEGRWGANDCLAGLTVAALDALDIPTAAGQHGFDVTSDLLLADVFVIVFIDGESYPSDAVSCISWCLAHAFDWVQCLVLLGSLRIQVVLNQLWCTELIHCNWTLSGLMTRLYCERGKRSLVSIHFVLWKRLDIPTLSLRQIWWQTALCLSNVKWCLMFNALFLCIVSYCLAALGFHLFQSEDLILGQFRYLILANCHFNVGFWDLEEVSVWTCCWTVTDWSRLRVEPLRRILIWTSV